MLVEPEIILAEDANALSLMQFVSTDTTPQDVFIAARSGNQDNSSSKTMEAFKIDSCCSILGDSVAMNIVKDPLLIDSGESTLDWMNKNMNFDSENILNQSLEFPEYLDLNLSSEISVPYINTSLQLPSDQTPSSSFSDNSNVMDVGHSPIMHHSSSKRTESEGGEIYDIEASSFCNDSTSSSSSKKICATTPSEKYLEMRRKNNIASQQSRKMRKVKDLEMTEKLKKLETENKKLFLLAENLEKKRNALQKYLLQVIAQK